MEELKKVNRKGRKKKKVRVVRDKDMIKKQKVNSGRLKGD